MFPHNSESTEGADWDVGVRGNGREIKYMTEIQRADVGFSFVLRGPLVATRTNHYCNAVEANECLSEARRSH